jgi:hypothetical protein
MVRKERPAPRRWAAAEIPVTTSDFATLTDQQLSFALAQLEPCRSRLEIERRAKV